MKDRTWPEGVERLLARLGGDEAASALAALVFDFCIDQPVGRFVDPESVLSIVDQMLKEQVLERVVTEHVRSFFDRELRRSEKRGDRIEGWLTDRARGEIRGMVGRPVRFKRQFLENLVRQDAVRHMLRSIIEEALARFVDSLKPDRKGGLLAAVGRGAAGVASTMSRGLLGKIGSQLQTALSRAADAFIEGSMDVMLRHTVDLLSSPEMARRLGELNQTGFDRSMELTVHQVVVALHRLPLDDLLRLVPALVVHNWNRPDLRQSYLDELRAVLEVESRRSVREVLAESDSVAFWRAEVVRLVTPLVTECSRQDRFFRWVEEQLRE